MEEQKFNELLISVMKRWDESKDAKAILEDNTGELELTEENQKILEIICSSIDKTAQKMEELKAYKAEGGTGKQWIQGQFDGAYDAIGATDEQKAQVTELVNKALESVTQRIALEPETSISESQNAEPKVSVEQPSNEVPNKISAL